MRLAFFWCLLGILTWPALAASPTDLPGLLLWLRADHGVQGDAGGPVARWEDQSGAGHHFLEPNPALQPHLVAQAAGAQPAVRFDGVDDALTLATAPLPVAGRSVFAVVKWNEARTYSFALGCGEGTDGYLRLHTDTGLLTGGRYPLLYQNGIASPKSGRTPADISKPFHLGLRSLRQWNVYAITDNPPGTGTLKYLGRNEANNTPANRFAGEIAEVLVYDRALTARERAQVEEYLQRKYLGWPAMRAVPVAPDAAAARALAPAADQFPAVVVSAGSDPVLAHGLTDRPLRAGRYRLHGTLTAPALSGAALSIRIGAMTQAWAPRPGEVPTDVTLDYTHPLDAPVAPVLVRLSGTGTVPPGEQGAAIGVRGLYLESLSPVTVQAVRVDKILYAPGQAAVASVTLANAGAEARTVEVRCLEVTGLDSRRPLGSRTLAVPAGGEGTVTLPFTAGTIEYGRDLLAEVVSHGAVVDRRTEPYSVADSLWKVALSAPGGGAISSSANYADDAIVKGMQEARKAYCNWFEKAFWAPDDWGVLTTPPNATWFSGQARRHENTEKLQLQIATAQTLGMRAITYGKCMAGGLPGWELARRRPQWFSVNAHGRTMGRPADVWDLEHWQEADKYKYADYKYPWTYRWVDLRRLDALDYGIDALIASARQFGWDGVRFDSGGFRAHFVDGKFDGIDSFNARNTRRMKERLWEAHPGFLFGYNTNDPIGQAATKAAAPLTPADPCGHEFREMLAGGGLWMFEGLRDRPHFWGRRTYLTWRDYATDMVQAVHTIKGYGGHVCFSYGDPGLYKFILGTMLGAHDYMGDHQRAKGSEHWGQFLTRWSGVLWDHRLRALPNAEQVVQVATERPVWWKEFANELVVSPTKRYVIVHLLNPPVNDAVGKTADEIPAPIAQATVQVRHGRETLVRALFIAPGAPNRAVALTPQYDKIGLANFTLPRLDIWAMVVVELEGTYTLPTEAPAFTEPLTAQEAAEMARCQHRFNVPTADNVRDPTPHFDPEKAGVKSFGASTVTMPTGYTIGGEPGTDVLLIKGFYHDAYRLPAALQSAGVRVAECTTRDLPTDYPDLAKYDVIVLVNMGAESWDANGHQRLADFARAGGRLVLLGGPFTLGQGFFKGTELEAVLPVVVRTARDVYQLPTPLLLGAQPGVPFPGKPVLFYYHAVTPKPDVRVRLWAGDLPLCYESAVGKGTVCVFVGTTMGEGAGADQSPFWTWEGWPAVVRGLVMGWGE
jgi:hypothetical protein